VELDADTSPVNFESAVQAIQSMSDIISEGPEDLLTGPQTINLRPGPAGSFHRNPQRDEVELYPASNVTIRFLAWTI